MIHFLAGDGIKGDLNQDLVLLDLGLIAPTILNLITNAGVNLYLEISMVGAISP